MHKIKIVQVTSNFWQIWKEFEVRHGNEDTMREMLRIKRSVQAMYNTQVNMMSAQMLNNASNQVPDVPMDAMRLLDSKVTSRAGTRDAKIKPYFLLSFHKCRIILNNLELQIMPLMSKEASNLYVV